MLWGVVLGFYTQALLFLISINCTGGTVTNRTIDDEFGDSVTGTKPIFLPTTEGIWAGEECTGCRVQPDRAIAFKGTWTAATYRPEEGGSGPISIDLSFKGTGIYVFFITGNQIAGGIITTLTECNFTLDGQHAGFFQHIPDQTTDMNYNVLAFSRSNLQNINHALRVSTSDVSYHVFVNFDYAVYTFDDGLETPPPSPPRSSLSSNLSPSPSSSTTMSEIPSITPGSIPTSAGNSSSPGSSATLSADLVTISKNSSIAAPSSTAASTTTPSPDHKQVPMGAILGGSIGGLALALLALALLLVCLNGKKQRKELTLTPTIYPSIQNSTERQMGGLRDPRVFSLHKRISSRPRVALGLAENHDIKTPRRSSNVPDVAQHAFTKGGSNFGTIEAGSSNETTGPSSSLSPVAADALRTRQMDLERRLREAERGLRAIGVEPQRDSPGSNTSPVIGQTGTHINYRREQGEAEEPPPEYSAG